MGPAHESQPTVVCESGPQRNSPQPPDGKDQLTGRTLRCTFRTCTSKDEDRVFTGKCAKSAYKRHMDTHTKPYTCHYTNCERNKRGFSRKDNLNIHLKSHLARKARDNADMSSTTTQDVALRRIERTAQRDMLRLLVKTANALMSRMEIEQEFPDVETPSGANAPRNEVEMDGEPATSPVPCTE